MRFRYMYLKENIKELFYFIKNLPGYYKLQKNYGYEPHTYSYIIENYETVLWSRTKTLSKPNYAWQVVVSELDRWYEEE